MPRYRTLDEALVGEGLLGKAELEQVLVHRNGLRGGLGYRDAHAAELKDIIAMLGLEQLSPDDRNVVARARRLERFLTQPFFTTEQFTGLPGKLVSLADALDGCERILADEFKDVPESALYMIGAVDEAKAKPKTEDTHVAAPDES